MKRGQAALEYLTTYGWAFMVVLVMIGALTYMGVTNTDTIIPEQCTISTGFGCEDYQVQETDISLILKNNMKNTVYVSKINFSLNGVDADPDCGLLQAVGGGPPQATFYTLNPGLKLEAVCTSDPDLPLIAGEKSKLKFLFVYKKSWPDGFAHRVEGELIAEVQT